MISLATGLRVYLACGTTDMRKGMAGLAMLVQQTLSEDPFICVGRDYVAAQPIGARLQVDSWNLRLIRSHYRAVWTRRSWRHEGVQGRSVGVTPVSTVDFADMLIPPHAFRSPARHCGAASQQNGCFKPKCAMADGTQILCVGRPPHLGLNLRRSFEPPHNHARHI
jgi:hypothetical protein